MNVLAEEGRREIVERGHKIKGTVTHSKGAGRFSVHDVPCLRRGEARTVMSRSAFHTVVYQVCGFGMSPPEKAGGWK